MVEKKQYGSEFKREAIRLQETSGKRVAEVERELGLSHGALSGIGIMPGIPTIKGTLGKFCRKEVQAYDDKHNDHVTERQGDKFKWDC